MLAGGERRPLERLILRLGEMPISEIDQMLLDRVAAELMPHASPATRNREIYTPVAAVLHRAGAQTRFRRPKGWRGNQGTSWLEPEQAFALFTAADAIDVEFGLFLRFLLYTGLRLSEALAVRMGNVDIGRRFVYVADTKTDTPRAVHLPPVLVESLKAQPPRPKRYGGRSQTDAELPFMSRHPDAKLFRFHASGHLRDLLAQAMKGAGLRFPRRQRGFHLMRHTYGTWMHRYGNLDTFGLARTGTWADPRSADRYKHTKASEEALRADLLPAPSTANGGDV
jgi:integrase